MEEEVLRAGEITIRVLKEHRKMSKARSYMCLYRTACHAVHPVVLYEYRPDRKASNATNFLNSFSG